VHADAERNIKHLLNGKNNSLKKEKEKNG